MQEWQRFLPCHSCDVNMQALKLGHPSLSARSITARMPRRRKVITSLDELEYAGGYPTVETIQKLYDQLDMQRAAQAYLDFMPAMSMQPS